MSQAGIVDIPLDIATSFVEDVGSASPAGGILNILGGVGITTSGSGNTITINATGTGFTWNVVTSSDNPVQIVVENCYVCAGSSMVDFVLPLTASVGDTFKIFSYTSKFQIAPNANQILIVGAVTGLTGSTGTVTSTGPGDEITFTYMGGNIFQSEAPQGTMQVVYT